MMRSYSLGVPPQHVPDQPNEATIYLTKYGSVVEKIEKDNIDKLPVVGERAGLAVCQSVNYGCGGPSLKPEKNNLGVYRYEIYYKLDE